MTKILVFVIALFAAPLAFAAPCGPGQVNTAVKSHLSTVSFPDAQVQNYTGAVYGADGEIGNAQVSAYHVRFTVQLKDEGFSGETLTYLGDATVSTSTCKVAEHKDASGNRLWYKINFALSNP